MNAEDAFNYSDCEFKDLPDNNLQTKNLGLNFEPKLIVK